MRYLRIKDYSEKTSAEAYVFMNDKNVSTLPSSWTLEFFVHCNIKSGNTTTLPIMNYKLFPTVTATTSEDCIIISISSTNLSFKVGSTIKTQSNINNKWNHIAITYQSTDSIIIYVNATKLLTTKVSSLSFKDYPKFDKFLFTLHKGDNNICYAGIQVYKSIKYDAAGFDISLPDQITYGDNKINEPIIDVDGHVIDYNEMEKILEGNKETYNNIFEIDNKNKEYMTLYQYPQDIIIRSNSTTKKEEFTNNKVYICNKNLEFIYFLNSYNYPEKTADGSFYYVNKSDYYYEVYKENTSTAKIYKYIKSMDAPSEYTTNTRIGSASNLSEQIFFTEDVATYGYYHQINEDQLIYADIDLDDYSKNGFTIEILYKHIGENRHPLLYLYEIIENNDGTEIYPAHDLFDPLKDNYISNTCNIMSVNIAILGQSYSNIDITSENVPSKKFIIYTPTNYKNSYVHYYLAFKGIDKNNNNIGGGGIIGRINGKIDFSDTTNTNQISILDSINNSPPIMTNTMLSYDHYYAKFTSSFISHEDMSIIKLISAKNHKNKKARLYLNLKKDDRICFFICKKYFNPDIKSFEVNRYIFGPTIERKGANVASAYGLNTELTYWNSSDEDDSNVVKNYNQILPDNYKDISLLYPYDINHAYITGHSSKNIHNYMKYFCLTNRYYDLWEHGNTLPIIPKDVLGTNEDYQIVNVYRRFTLKFNTEYNKIGYPIEYNGYYPIEACNKDDNTSIDVIKKIMDKFYKLPSRNTLEFITINPCTSAYDATCVECWIYFKVINNTDPNYYDLMTLSFISPDLNVTIRVQPSTGKLNYIIAQKIASKLVCEANYNNNTDTEFADELEGDVLKPNQWNHIAFIISPMEITKYGRDTHNFEPESATYIRDTTDDISKIPWQRSDFVMYIILNNNPLFKKNYSNLPPKAVPAGTAEVSYNLLAPKNYATVQSCLYALYLQKILLYMRNEYSSYKLLLVGLKVQHNAGAVLFNNYNYSETYICNSIENFKTGSKYKQFNLEKTK